MIDPSKKYTTRDGKPVTHLHRAPEGWPTSFPWRGIVGEATARTWNEDGVVYIGEKSQDDLVEVHEPMRLKVWTKNGNGPIFRTSDTQLNMMEMHELGYALKEFVEVMP